MLTDLHLCSFRLHPEYNSFQSKLKEALPLPDGLILPIKDDARFNAVLKILQTEREREKEKDGGKAATEDMADEVDLVEDGLKILVQNVTQEFGFAPCDVYNGILDFPHMEKNHNNAMWEFDYYKLATLVKNFPEGHQPNNFLQCVVVVHPHKFLDDLDRWEIDFKSVRIGRKLMERIRREENNRLRETYNLFHNIQEGSTLAGWTFEALAHHMFTKGWEGPPPKVFHMESNGGDPPVFCSSSSPSKSLDLRIRNVTEVNFKYTLSNMTLGGDKYYIPAMTDNPLFNSFTIKHHRIRHIVEISVFQITVSKTHRGSPEGYRLIRKIMDRVHVLLNEVRLKAKVEVEYFLVCPKQSQLRWEMPGGWDENVTRRDHRGKVKCLYIPISEFGTPWI